MAEAARLATAATPLNRETSGGSRGLLKRGTSHYELEYQVGLNENAIKAQFVQKVYTILGAQIALTVAIICAFVYHKPTQALGISALKFFASIGQIPAMLLILLITMPPLCACFMYKDQYPANFWCLLAFTAIEGLFVGMICGAYAASGRGDAIVYAGGTTALIFFCLSAYARYSGHDFSFMGMYLFVALCANCLLGFIAFLAGWTFMIWLYHVGGVIIFSGYIVYDTDQICNKVSLENVETGEAITGALTLYLDIINLFLHLLALFGDRN
jgi:hypothetical protein